jgi:RimJ/RimL family protein N-acetyltransferase
VNDVAVIGLIPERIETPRLVLAPLPDQTARAVLAGDLSSLPHAAGWPHADTLDAFRMTLAPNEPSRVWLVMLGRIVIGDCGTVGGVNTAGDVELGYGLAVEHRGFGYGTEVVTGLSRWLIEQPGVRRVVAREVLASNIPSRRALERAGFRLERETDGRTWYAFTP